MNGFLEWQYAIHCKRLSLLAEGKGWFRNPVELYAHEAGPLFSFVSGVVR